MTIEGVDSWLPTPIRVVHRFTPVMKDSSSVTWFSVGDRVKVITDSQFKKGVSLFGKHGVVKETWEKCEVDPTW